MDAGKHGSAPRRRTAGRIVAWTVTTATLVGLGQSPTAAATVVPEGALVPVVVEGAADAAAAEVARLGGVVDHRPAARDGVHARVPAVGLTALRRVDGVSAVTPGSAVVSLCEEWDDIDEGPRAGRGSRGAADGWPPDQ
jgi:serine protease AprX